MALFRMGAMPPVIGSRSLKATRNGLSQAASRSHAARLATVAGSLGEVGTRPGMARGPATKLSSGKGAS
jgi:hypothetical protein